MKFCGKVVKLNRIYISNRTVHALSTAIDEYSRIPSYDSAVHVMQSINSYFGLMKGTASFNIKKRMARKALKAFSEWLYFRNRNGRFICVLKSKYKPSKTSHKHLNQYASIFRPPQRHYPKRRLPVQLREPAYLRA